MVYLAGIRLLYIENGIADPMKNTPLVHYLLTAIRRSSARKPLQRHPIIPALLVTLKTQLHQSDLTSRDRAMFWAAFTLHFMGSYVRVSILHHRHATSIQHILYHGPVFRLGRSLLGCSLDDLRLTDLDTL